MSGPSSSIVVIHQQSQPSARKAQQKHQELAVYSDIRLTATGMLNFLREAIVISHRTNGYEGRRVS